MKEWQPLEEVVGAALIRLEAQLHERPLTTHFPADLPLVPLDSVLIEQVLMNVLDNAVKYTLLGSPIALTAWATEDAVTVEVAGRGPGLPLERSSGSLTSFTGCSAPPCPAAPVWG